MAVSTQTLQQRFDGPGVVRTGGSMREPPVREGAIPVFTIERCARSGAR